MTRPSPRKSSLSGSSPIVPPAVEPAVAPVARKAEDSSASGKKWRHKVSFYQDPADTARVRGAILYTMTTEGNRNLSQFVARAVMAEVERLERKYNGGRPFPPVGARELPQGGAAASGD